MREATQHRRAPLSHFREAWEIKAGGAGPRPIRGERPPDIYGLPGLTPGEKKKVREGTACALRAVEMAWEMEARGPP